MDVLPVSRFLLATLGILTTEHRANSVSLLLNSGVLALTQTVLRLIGKFILQQVSVQARGPPWL